MFGITQAMWRRIGQIGVLLTGPITNLLVQQFGMAEGSIKLWLDLFTAVTVIGGGGWALADSTPAAVVKDAKDIEGVQVHVDTTTNPETGKPVAPESVVKLAESPMPDIFPMIGGPRVPTEHEIPSSEARIDPSKQG